MDAKASEEPRDLTAVFVRQVKLAPRQGAEHGLDAPNGDTYRRFTTGGLPFEKALPARAGTVRIAARPRASLAITLKAQLPPAGGVNIGQDGDVCDLRARAGSGAGAGL
jgi:hypothetical protein